MQIWKWQRFDFMEEMRSLVDRLNQLNYHYYVLDEPLVSDDEWDALYKR